MNTTARAMQVAMPAIQQALGQAVATIERETANLPSPNYPRRWSQTVHIRPRCFIGRISNDKLG